MAMIEQRSRHTTAFRHTAQCVLECVARFHARPPRAPSICARPRSAAAARCPPGRPRPIVIPPVFHYERRTCVRTRSKITPRRLERPPWSLRRCSYCIESRAPASSETPASFIVTMEIMRMDSNDQQTPNGLDTSSLDPG